MVGIKMKISDLMAILKGNINRIDEVDVNDLAMFEVKVPVYPSDVKTMLSKYLSDEISSDDLSKWGAFLCLRGEYGSSEEELRIDEDFYETMWNVVQALSAPEIDGEITKAQVRGYFDELEKYKNE
jgi:hypothetical protein